MREYPYKYAEKLFHEMLTLQGRGNTLYGCPEQRAKSQAKLTVKMLRNEAAKSLTPFINLDLGRRLIDDSLAYYDEVLRILDSNKF